MADAPRFIWTELATDDVDACREFYSRLLGWTARETDMGEAGTYHIWQAQGEDVGGMYALHGTDAAPQWLPYIRVDDVDEHAARVQMLGGSVTVPPADIPGIGRFCMIADPRGAAVALITTAPR